MVKGLRLALDAALDDAAARPVLDGFALAIRLAGVVGLDALCEKFVEGVCPLHSWQCTPGPLRQYTVCVLVVACTRARHIHD